ncbi:Snoa-like polyketide cyclase [Colletotrichum incanum]|uniref:Snoa-like polyketide cyclase n=1 Tax=Colletotrichum incanum TaxID=1573173 RepID=A0A166RCC8_COLIC|nr:Snoa-like polyketide cyclase [Colletotrichum incanum]
MAAQGVGAALQAFLDAANNKKWDEVQEHLQPAVTVTYNENQESRDDFVQRLTATAEKGDQLSADSWTVDEAAQSVGARLVTSIKKAAEGTPAKVWDLILVFFEDGKISRFYQIASQLSRSPHAGPWAPEVTSKPSKNPLSASEISTLYREYIYSYNTGAVATILPQRWAKVVSFHGNSAPVEMILGILKKVLVPVIAGLKYEVEEMVVDVERQQIALRLALEGVPENKNLQKNGPGEKIKVYEHALYGYEEGKIAWGWAAQGFDMTPPPGSEIGDAPR